MASNGRRIRQVSSLSRRGVLGAGLACGVEALAQTSTAPSTRPEALPRRPLGKTGEQVTRLAMGGSFSEYGPRLLDFAFKSGIRYFDMGDFYAGFKAEIILGDWIRKRGNRKDVFIVNKARTWEPEAFLKRVDEAFSKMKIEMIDAFFIHDLGDPQVALDSDGTWRKIKEKLIREKRIRFMGFSTHAELSTRIACVNNAPKGKWADAVMVACDPVLIRSTPELNKALDACANAGIGLVAMKTGRGLGKLADQPKSARDAFRKLGHSAHTAMLAGIWSDERFASACSEMPSIQLIEENAAAARAFRKPFDAEQWKAFDEAARSLARATCPGCDGSCRKAAGTQADLCSITRYLAYYRESGNRDLARDLLAQLPAEKRDWTGADLKAAAGACRAHLDFESLLPLAKRLIG